jgi:hypothetical protein
MCGSLLSMSTRLQPNIRRVGVATLLALESGKETANYPTPGIILFLLVRL